MKPSHLLWAPLVLTIAGAGTAAAADPTPDYDAAWAQLKRLAGTWDSHIVGREGRTSVISYHVTSNESVVFEEFLGEDPGDLRDMATAYHRDVDELVATHYCGARNQPRMRSVSYDPEERLLQFDFWDITNLPDPQAYYTTNIVLHFIDDDNAELRFRGTTDGTQGDWQIHKMRRLTRRAFEAPAQAE